MSFVSLVAYPENLLIVKSLLKLLYLSAFADVGVFQSCFVIPGIQENLLWHGGKESKEAGDLNKMDSLIKEELFKDKNFESY